jgi:hypothetical protein
MNPQILNDITFELQKQQWKLDNEILRTPSGYVRNILTEANIHLLEAIKKLGVEVIIPQNDAITNWPDSDFNKKKES